MNQLYGNRRKIKLVRERTQNTKLKLNNTKQKIKRANSRGAGEKITAQTGACWNMSKFARTSKNYEKLEKSQFLLKLLNSSGKGGTRVPSKNCNFCDFSKNCLNLVILAKTAISTLFRNFCYCSACKLGHISFLRAFMKTIGPPIINVLHPQ